MVVVLRVSLFQTCKQVEHSTKWVFLCPAIRIMRKVVISDGDLTVPPASNGATHPLLGNCRHCQSKHVSLIGLTSMHIHKSDKE